MRVIFVRHAESTANIDMPAEDLAQIALSERGWEQAHLLARSWVETPSKIAVSPFLRTKLTAAPTLAKFPDVPVVELPMEEFTYLEPAAWRGSRAQDRWPAVKAYWEACLPDHQTGPGAESFSALLQRVDTTLQHLALLEPGLVYAFTHGQFMVATRLRITCPKLSSAQLMARFPREKSFQNTERMEIELFEGKWRLSNLRQGVTVLV